MSEGFKHGYALLIGVGGDLAQTRNDAKALYDLLINPQRAGYPPGHVELLTDQTDPKANRQAILDAFDRLRDKAVNDADATVFIYYSGHGHEFVVNGAAVGYYLLPLNYNLKDLNNTAISGKIFTDKLKAIHAKKQIVFLDCCFAAGIAKTKDELVNSQPQNMPSELRTLELGSGQVVVASCDAGQKSVTDQQHSVFTRALLEALEGKAYTWDGYARFFSVLRYLFEEVPVKAAQYQVEQTVVLKTATDLKGDFALCRVPGAKLSLPNPDTRFSHLYKAVLPMGFSREQLDFVKLRKTSYTNAYLITGELWYGHYWLLRRLLDELAREGGIPREPIDMSRHDNRADVGCIWAELCWRLGIADDSPKEVICQNIADELDNHPVWIVLKNVEYMQPGEMANLMSDFWDVLAEGVRQKVKDTARQRLYLFLVYIEEPGRIFPLALPEKRERLEAPHYLLGWELSNLQEEIAYAWISSKDINGLLDEKGCTAVSGGLEPLFTKLWQDSSNGIPEKVAGEFFRLLNAKYRGLDQWLQI